MLVKKHLDLLGYIVRDKASDYEGVVTSMSFDLYGCIQALVRPVSLDEKGKIQEGMWMDVSRISVISEEPLMDQPGFKWGRKGPARLPMK